MARMTLTEQFIQEFLVDRDPLEAARRVGVAQVSRKATVRKWMADPKVRSEIDRRTLEMDPATMIKPQWVIAKFQEIAASRFASESAKNTALTNLAKLAKMYPKESGGSDDDEPRRRGVLLVPADAASLDDWERVSMRSQERLKQDVRK